MIKNYIFDFGNVLVRFDPETIMKPYISEKTIRDALAPIVFDRKYWDRLDDGSLTEEEVFAYIKKRIPDGQKMAVKSSLENWYYHLPVIEQTKNKVDELKSSGNKLYLLSNISKTFADNYTKVDALKDLLNKFDGLIFSGREGLVKPNREIFELILNRYELLPEETIFIDDSRKNLEGASKLGIHTFLFEDNIDKINYF